MDAAGIVPDHPAQGAVFVRRRIGSVHDVVRLELLVKLIQNYAGLDARDPALRIDFDDPVQVLRHVDDDARIATLSGQTCSSSSGEDRRAELPGSCERFQNVIDCSRYDNADWNLAIVGRIRRIERPGSVIESDFALDTLSQCCSQTVGFPRVKDRVSGFDGLEFPHDYTDFPYSRALLRPRRGKETMKPGNPPSWGPAAKLVSGELLAPTAVHDSRWLWVESHCRVIGIAL